MKSQKLKAALCVGAFGIAAGLGNAPSLAAQSQQPSYKTVTEVYDWGPSVSKVIVNLGRTVNSGDISAQNFRVHVRRELAEGAASPAEAASEAEAAQGNRIVLGAESRSDKDIEGEREVTRAYVSDADGNQQSRGEHVVLEFAVSPTDTLGAALNFDLRSFFNDWVKQHYTITVGETVIDNNQGDIRPQADKFTYGIGRAGDRMSYPYASYEPQDGGKHPLIVWLHGMGEGGNSPSLPIMANKAVAFADESIQRYFGGAYVLAPQARTYWMHGFKSFADGTSIYSETLMEFIKNYVAAHPGVDENRIYVGGDSNGGYMTMLLIRDNPGYFAAAFPTCEGLRDDLIKRKDLRNIAKTPVWFIAAKTDTTLPPADYAVPTVERLRKIRGADVHFSFFDKVVDTSGQYKQADGSPYEYQGHWSWIYVYNDECEDNIDGHTVKLFAWMAGKTRR